jgi:DNA-binding transcriptional regulator YiaG
MTPAQLKSARQALGLSAEGFARAVGVESGRTVRRWEAGDRDIPGPVIAWLDLVLHLPAARRRLGLGKEKAPASEDTGA